MRHRNVEQYKPAKAAIRSYPRDGDWHASREILVARDDLENARQLVTTDAS